MKKQRSGLTLMELLVVLAILAILAALVLPKLDGLMRGANHAVGAAGADDTGRYIQMYLTTKNRLPDGWDSLLDGTTLWAANNPGTTPPTPGLHQQLTGFGATKPKLSTTTLAAGEAAALNSAGIYTIFHYTTGSTVRPGDRFNTQDTIADGSTVAIVNPDLTGGNGRKIIDHIYRDNLKSSGTSGTIPTGKKLVVFGFGPHNALVGKSMLEVPFYPNVDPTLVYNRNLVVFEVGTSGRAVFKAVLGADGDLIDDMAADLFKDQ